MHLPLLYDLYALAVYLPEFFRVQDVKATSRICDQGLPMPVDSGRPCLAINDLPMGLSIKAPPSGSF